MISIFWHILAKNPSNQKRLGSMSKLKQKEILAKLEALEVGESFEFTTYAEEYMIRQHMDWCLKNNDKRFVYAVDEDSFRVKRDR